MTQKYKYFVANLYARMAEDRNSSLMYSETFFITNDNFRKIFDLTFFVLPTHVILSKFKITNWVLELVLKIQSSLRKNNYLQHSD